MLLCLVKQFCSSSTLEKPLVVGLIRSMNTREPAPVLHLLPLQGLQLRVLPHQQLQLLELLLPLEPLLVNLPERRVSPTQSGKRQDREVKSEETE
jgi:hypothetical protein